MSGEAFIVPEVGLPAGFIPPSAALAPPAPDIDDDPYDGDEYDDEHCSHCGGEWYLQECDDPIQCCDPRCDGEFHPDPACGGTGLARHQVLW